MFSALRHVIFCQENAKLIDSSKRFKPTERALRTAAGYKPSCWERMRLVPTTRG